MYTVNKLIFTLKTTRL